MKGIKGGVNFRTARKISYVYNALRPAGRVNEENSNFVPENVLFSQPLDTDGTLKDLIRETRYKRGLIYGPEPHPNDQLYRNRPSEKVMLTTRVRHGRDGTGYGYESLKSLVAFPFNIVSSSVTTGHNKQVVERVTGNIEITNLHHDVYGEDMEKPMQTTFTEYAVGGHQSRHIGLNTGTDNETTRPEAWKIYLGYPYDSANCPKNSSMSGVLAMVGPDYPQANASQSVGYLPYPATASQKAPWYRDFTAKRPVNIKNIKHTTGSGTTTVLGNYDHNYDIVQTVGATSNPVGFRDQQPKLPTTVFSPDRPNTHQATSVRTILDIYRGATNGVYTTATASAAVITAVTGHFDFAGDYSTSYLTGTKSKSIITQRFAHRGGIEVMSRGYQDFRSTEFSVYNSINYRNLTVRRPFQHMPSTSASAESNGIRVYDIHGNDYGFNTHATRHAGRFFRDSILEATPGTSYDEKPAFHRVHRNNISLPKIATETFTYATIPPVLTNEKFAKAPPGTGSLSFFLTGTTSQQYLQNSLMAAMTGSGGGAANDPSTGGSGFSFSGWVKFTADGTTHDVPECLWGIGFRSGNTPLMRLVKETESTLADGVDWTLEIDTETNGGTGKTNTYKWNSKIDFSGSWNHIALVWGRPYDGGSVRAQPPASGDGIATAAGETLKTADSGATFYINGISQSYESFTSDNGHMYEQSLLSVKNDYKGFANLKLYQVDGSGVSMKDKYAFIGGKWAGGADTGDALFADIDEWSFWTIALDSGSIQELYNSGVPCDITASTMYENSGTFLFDWLRFENPADNNAFVVDANNPGTYSSGNKLLGHTNSSSWMPLNLAGGTNWTVSAENLLSGCVGSTALCHDITYTCDVTNDNLNVSHPIPRSDRQYAFFTGAMVDPDPCNFRYSGYMPVFGPMQGMYKSSSTNYEVWLPLISGSDFGVYNYSTANQTVVGATKKWISDTANTSEG